MLKSALSLDLRSKDTSASKRYSSCETICSSFSVLYNVQWTMIDNWVRSCRRCATILTLNVSYGNDVMSEGCRGSLLTWIYGWGVEQHEILPSCPGWKGSIVIIYLWERGRRDDRYLDAGKQKKVNWLSQNELQVVQTNFCRIIPGNNYC